MKFSFSALWLALLAPDVFAAVPYSQYILTPVSRTLRPVSVHNINGTVLNADSLTGAAANVVMQGPSAVTYDMGKNVAGIVSFNVTSGSGFVGISFTESSLWINSQGCDATADAGLDEALWFSVSSGGRYTAEKQYQRGGFRYLNVYHNTTGDIEIGGLSIYFTALPQLAESQLASYSGYFHCEDDQLNRVWYAGAYTNELCTIDPTAGSSLVHLGEILSNQTINGTVTWYNNYTITNGSSALVDGAKRDRLVWPGDMAVAVPSMMVSTYDMQTIKNSLDSLLILQTPEGALPYAGLPFGIIIPVFSFTYHLYSLIAINDHYLYTGDLAYLQQNWPKFKLGLNYSLSFVDDSGLANVTSAADWLRFGMGGHNIEANSILYYTLNLGVSLAKVLNDDSVANWSSIASGIKTSAYQRLWDPTSNLYRDNDTMPLTDLHPQDGNSWAVVSNITTSAAQNVNISKALSARWGPYGAPAPEAGATVSPFISSFELQAHYVAGQASSAVRLMKFMWGDFMLDDPRMTNSTFLEGYSTDGTLHYAPYTNDPRISHAHGWATGPTSALSFYAAGLQITSAAGKTWLIAPSLGGLHSVEAGYKTNVGSFTSKVVAETNGSVVVAFETPEGTTGNVSMENPGKKAKMTVHDVMQRYNDVVVDVPAGGTQRVAAYDVPGGKYVVTLAME